MSFWNDKEFTVKRSYRWQLHLGATGYKTFLAKKVDKPSYSIGQMTHQYLNHKFHYPGQVTWNDISATLVDPIAPDGSAMLLQMFGDSGYRLPSSEEVLGTVSKQKAVDALGDVHIDQLDASGKTIETWIVVNAWVKDFKFGSLDYASEDMLSLDLTMTYDYAYIDKHKGAIEKSG